MENEINIISDLPDLILHGLLYNEDFYRQTIPFIKKDYFEDQPSKLLFSEIDTYGKKYNTAPSVSALSINLGERKGISQDDYKNSLQKLKEIHLHQQNGQKTDQAWLVDSCEKWCKDRAFYSVLFSAAEAINAQKDVTLLNIPEQMTDALGISFDTSIGHDYIMDSDKRFEFYHSAENKIPCPLEIMNKITNGGPSLKTLTCLMSTTTGGFKSGFMCAWAAFLIRMGYDVLYITAEMSEEKIGERIDANLMNLEINYVLDLPKTLYTERMEKVKKNVTGRLFIKEYPTSTAHAGHFRYLLKELALKKNFRPKVVFFDYLNICASSRMSVQNCNSYTYIKSIAEELRGLAVEMNFAAITGTQGNRGAITAQEVGLADVSESIGLPATTDLFLAIITSESLDKMGHLMMKQLKNRYQDLNHFRQFIFGVNKAKMQVYDVNAQPAPATAVIATGTTSTGGSAKKTAFDQFQFD